MTTTRGTNDVMDSLIAVFGDGAAARLGLQRLLDEGRPTDLVEMRRVIDTDYRGLGDDEAAHTLMHSPVVPDSSPLAEETGVHIVVVKVADTDEARTAMAVLEEAGAERVVTVEGTPPLDL